MIPRKKNVSSSNWLHKTSFVIFMEPKKNYAQQDWITTTILSYLLEVPAEKIHELGEYTNIYKKNSSVLAVAAFYEAQRPN